MSFFAACDININIYKNSTYSGRSTNRKYHIPLLLGYQSTQN